jgi:predicted regulator of Ras-like GTPase activity (Roadblock/LC7/MglB family)
MTVLAQSLRKTVGREASVIFSRDGIVLVGDMDVDAEKEGAVAVFVGNAADHVGEALGLTSFDSGVITMGNREWCSSWKDRFIS